MRIRSRRYVIPDLAVFWPDEPIGAPETPPLVAIEVLSLHDRLAEIRDKLEEYKAGVRLADGSALPEDVHVRGRSS